MEDFDFALRGLRPSLTPAVLARYAPDSILR
jgi:hypothetical protein